jgi:hypothetical protein
MATPARIRITNVFMGGDYTGEIFVGPNQQPLNVILDTGSSALAVSGRKYHPTLTSGEAETNLAQADSYGDGSHWTGAVLTTPVAIGTGAAEIAAQNIPIAVAYDESLNMFRGADGILGLAYEALDDAHEMPAKTWSAKFPTSAVVAGGAASVVPYLTQLADDNLLPDKVSFLTRRSFIHEGSGLGSDPLNQGWMIVGGGEEATDLYSGSFQVVKVLSQAWYSTNLKQVIVHGQPPINLRARGRKGVASNSIVDSGTNSLNLGPTLLRQIFTRLSASQQQQLGASVIDGKTVPMASLNLSTWPTITFVLEGVAGDVSLSVAASDYWQVNAPRVGDAMAAITQGNDGQAILGLPLMNGYFTVFDGEADGGMGQIKFAKAVR